MGMTPIRAGSSAEIPFVFTIVNSSFSHSIQSEAGLVQVSRIICRLIQGEQEIVRFGMDEFLAAAVAAMHRIGKFHDYIAYLFHSHAIYLFARRWTGCFPHASLRFCLGGPYFVFFLLITHVDANQNVAELIFRQVIR